MRRRVLGGRNQRGPAARGDGRAAGRRRVACRQVHPDRHLRPVRPHLAKALRVLRSRPPPAPARRATAAASRSHLRSAASLLTAEAVERAPGKRVTKYAAWDGNIGRPAQVTSAAGGSAREVPHTADPGLSTHRNGRSERASRSRYPRVDQRIVGVMHRMSGCRDRRMLTLRSRHRPVLRVITGGSRRAPCS